MRHSTAFAAIGLLLAAPAFAQAPAPIGVAECDDFVTKYEQCLNTSVPADQRAMYAGSITQMRDAWRQAAQNPQTRATLASQCTQMGASMGQSMAAYGCRF